QGFQLEEGWITFSVYENKIRVFYKQIIHGQELTDFWEPQSITYYRKDLPKKCPVIFTFTKADQVEKIGNQ
ncbi:413_t:CDS:1, partial [Scutellospora calospora]